jgi:hypothetical protein
MFMSHKQRFCCGVIEIVPLGVAPFPLSWGGFYPQQLARLAERQPGHFSTHVPTQSGGRLRKMANSSTLKMAIQFDRL